MTKAGTQSKVAQNQRAPAQRPAALTLYFRSPEEKEQAMQLLEQISAVTGLRKGPAAIKAFEAFLKNPIESIEFRFFEGEKLKLPDDLRRLRERIEKELEAGQFEKSGPVLQLRGGVVVDLERGVVRTPRFDIYPRDDLVVVVTETEDGFWRDFIHVRVRLPEWRALLEDLRRVFQIKERR